MTDTKKDKELLERNEKDKAFKENEKEQKRRDQLVMPIDELPLEDIKYEAEEEKKKKDSKDDSSSEEQ
ncbi:tRNA U34 2-thiouridine synthase MnmA/TrmU [Bacillus tianshenii]|uniref:tRNA U34 2-thiouridine synthase MnmA/TrmU n=1 Tax=Sutcliffiella tianshenii TaxID=1463404 RepID=A0ABS2NXS2_9BACI|nr:hypothetical protein [Bacillus tianshenii]MBM7619482.1 tRNA U34 2-thiouridine synthase MnmA/TrmU [Bacillus tianshenii]MCA1320679.1 hypothetical protein [Bacillus tianshenii]